MESVIGYLGNTVGDNGRCYRAFIERISAQFFKTCRDIHFAEFFISHERIGINDLNAVGDNDLFQIRTVLKSIIADLCQSLRQDH